MPATYEPIATQTLGSTATSITFSSIPSTYTDLRVVFTGTATGGSAATITFNSDTGSNYSWTRLTGNGTSAASAYAPSVNSIAFCGNAVGMSSTIPSTSQADLFSYSGSTFKSCLISDSSDRNGSGAVARVVGLWRNTTAISTVTINGNGGTFQIGSTATLYGIKSA